MHAMHNRFTGMAEPFPMTGNFDAKQFRQALGSFTTGVTIVTTVDADGCDVEIGRASCRERVCQYVSISVVVVSLKNKTTKTSKNDYAVCHYIPVKPY